MDHRENADSRLPALTKDPAENADATEPADPIDKIEPADPIDRIDPEEPIDKMDPLLPMLRNESSEPIDHERRLLVRILALSPAAVARSNATRRASSLDQLVDRAWHPPDPTRPGPRFHRGYDAAAAAGVACHPDRHVSTYGTTQRVGILSVAADIAGQFVIAAAHSPINRA
jgi:hypothetical protein